MNKVLFTLCVWLSFSMQAIAAPTASELKMVSGLSTADKLSLAKLSTADKLSLAKLSTADKLSLAKKAGADVPQEIKPDKGQLTTAETMKPLALKTSAIEASVNERLQTLSKTRVGEDEADDSMRGLDLKLRNAWQGMLGAQSARSVESGLSQYGYQLFSGSPTTFVPATDIPVPAEYVLGPGDELNIQFYGSKQESLQLVIDREGLVSMPSIGPLSLAGQNFQQAKALIAEKIHQHMIGVTGSVSMGRLRSMRVFVLGDVNSPGSYVVSGLSTISNALFVSGGISKKGSLRHIILKRAGKKVAELDLYDFLLRGDSHRDIRLLPGDVIFVPPVGDVVAVAGEVTRPAIYELKNNHSGISVAKLLQLAGGKLATADISHAQVDSITKQGNRALLDVGIDKKTTAKIVRNGDILLIYAVPAIRLSTVVLSGHVKRPGSFGFKKGMRLTDLIASKDDLLPNTFMDYMIIQRTNPITGALTVLRPALGKLLEQHDNDSSPVLKPDDKLMVFSNVMMVKLDSVTVTGAVQHPGAFPLGKGFKVSDLILAAGGPTENAYMHNAELTRYSIIHGKERVLSHIPVDLSKALSNDKQADIQLQAHDVVMVRSVSNWRDREMIELKGEFKFPGVYTIEDGETLAQVIARAGGFTEDAFVQAAVFSRQSIREQEQKQLNEYADRLEIEISQKKVSTQSLSNPKLILQQEQALTAANAVLEKYRQVKPVGRLLIDLDHEGVLKGGGTLKLADADMLYVPKKPDQILVMGEVYSPSAMLYHKNMARDDFIEQAGGLTSIGDEDRIYIVRANGFVDARNGWNTSHKIYPGDTIVVPQDLEAFNLLDSTLDWSKVLMQIGVFTASLVTVGIL